MLQTTYRISNGEMIKGRSRIVFIHNSDYFLTELSVYKDGMIECWGLMDFETFKRKVKSGWIVVRLPPNATVSISHLARFDVPEPENHITDEDFIQEVADEIESLNKRPTTSQICFKAFENFKDSPSESTKEELRKAYEAVPKYLRRYLLGDMDNKDIPIKGALNMI